MDATVPTQLGFDQVRLLLPQGHPMILVDRVEEIEPGARIVCLKNVTGSEWVFPGHFPQRAIFPGVLLIEGLAQAAILLFRTTIRATGATAEQNDGPAGTFLLVGVKMRLLQPVVPGDQLRYEWRAVKVVSTGAIVDATAQVGATPVARGELTFAVRAWE
jgi:3-hydroxyacyl-[acyl-carrier-protein] dehydratase